MISRRAFLAAMAAAPIIRRPAQIATPNASPASRRLPCAVNYDVSTFVMPGVATRYPGDTAFMADEIRTIRGDLHATQIGLYGSDPDAMLTAVDLALDQDLEVRAQLRINDQPIGPTLDAIAAFGAELESRAKAAGPILYDIGCEFSLFAGDVVPGETFPDRIAFLTESFPQDFPYQQRLNSYVTRLAEAARSGFSGQIAYSTYPEEPIDWRPLDVIGLDHYVGSTIPSAYVDVIDKFAAQGKPVHVHEFGCCAFTGAWERGGEAWNQIDWMSPDAAVPTSIQRDEREQAEAIQWYLEAISRSSASYAGMFTFIDPTSVRSNDPTQDFDALSYAVVACREDYAETGQWEKKAGFDIVAGWNAGIAETA